MENVTEKLSELHGDKNYSDSESENDDIMKFIKPRQKGLDFETKAYLFNKNAKLRTELARLEERMRYLQLDYSNSQVKLEEQKLLLTNLKSREVINYKVMKDLKNTSYIVLCFLSVSLVGNAVFCLMDSFGGPRVIYT
uniref:Uncharacterized protein n=1 Tax=viral metagenome TaxID=1070528 RepID=A0A6C0AYV4_9ZZZZ